MVCVVQRLDPFCWGAGHLRDDRPAQTFLPTGGGPVSESSLSALAIRVLTGSHLTTLYLHR
jgi:hypothetical protein